METPDSGRWSELPSLSISRLKDMLSGFYHLECGVGTKDKSMKTPNSGCWSELPIDILRSVFERLRFVDFHRAKMVCSNWYSRSKQSLLRKTGSPWIIVFPEDSGCALYNSEEAKIYRTKRDFSGTRFLANSGKWFLVLDSRSNLCIMDVFSEKRVHLPPLESLKGGLLTLERVGDKEFREKSYGCTIFQRAENLRGLLWVDEKKEEYVVVWFFGVGAQYLAYSKNGEDYYRKIPTGYNLPWELQGLSDVVLHGGDSLYILTRHHFIRKLKLSGQDGFMHVSNSDHTYPLLYAYTRGATASDHIVLTTSGEVLLVQNCFNKITRYRSFLLHTNSKSNKGNEAVLLDLGITVPADHTLGIEPNSIYFTCHDHVHNCGLKRSCLDICVFDLATKEHKRFPGLSVFDLRLKDARWFILS